MLKERRGPVSGALAALVVCAMAGQALAGAVPQVVSVGPEVNLGPAQFRSTIATDSRNQPHICTSAGTEARFYDLIGGAWRSEVMSSGVFGSSQYGNPHMEIAGDIAWCGGVLWGQFGIGLIVRENIASAPPTVAAAPKHRSRPSPGVWDSGNLSLDPAIPTQAVVSSMGGYYRVVRYAGGVVSDAGGGQMYTGQGGEKNSFHISKAGSVAHADGTTHAVWHGAIGGYYAYSSSYQNSLRAAQGQGPYPFAAASYYTQQNDDGCYVSVIGDSKAPSCAFMTQSYGGWGIAVNIWNGSDVAFGHRSLLNVDPNGSSGARRYAPQMAPAKNGGAFIMWVRGDRVKMRFIPLDATSLASCGPEVDVGAGQPGGIAVDSRGHVHVTYAGPSGQMYRKFTMTGDISSAVPACDYNNDGTADLAVYEPNGTWMIKPNAVRTVANSIIITQWGYPGCVSLPGDYNADGFADLGVYNPDLGWWYLMPMSRGGPTGTPGYIPWGYKGCIPVPGDYNGDGFTDLAVYNPDIGWWYILPLGPGRTGVPGYLQWGYRGCIPVPGDYNGDGITDLGVYDPQLSLWYLLPVLPGRTGTPGYVPFGTANGGGIPAPADYNGDGFTDLALYYPDTGWWWLMPITAGGLGTPGYLQWGYQGCVPVPGDYDGNGIMDLGVYDQAIGQWYFKYLPSLSVDQTSWGYSPCMPASMNP